MGASCPVLAQLSTRQVYTCYCSEIPGNCFVALLCFWSANVWDKKTVKAEGKWGRWGGKGGGSSCTSSFYCWVRSGGGGGGGGDSQVLAMHNVYFKRMCEAKRTHC